MIANEGQLTNRNLRIIQKLLLIISSFLSLSREETKKIMDSSTNQTFKYFFSMLILVLYSPASALKKKKRQAVWEHVKISIAFQNKNQGRTFIVSRIICIKGEEGRKKKKNRKGNKKGIEKELGNRKRKDNVEGLCRSQHQSKGWSKESKLHTS